MAGLEGQHAVVSRGQPWSAGVISDLWAACQRCQRSGSRRDRWRAMVKAASSGALASAGARKLYLPTALLHGSGRRHVIGGRRHWKRHLPGGRSHLFLAHAHLILDEMRFR